MNRNPLARELVIELVLALYLLGAVLGLWQHPLAVLIVVVVGILFQVFVWHEKADIALLFTGAILGLLGENFAVGKSYYAYAKSGSSGLPVYLPAVWGYLLVLFNRIGMTLHALSETRPWSRRLRKGVLTGAQFLFVGYFAVMVALIDRYVAAVCSIFLILAARLWHEPEDIMMFLVAALGGVTGEAISVQCGIWEYAKPYFSSIGIPLSLPILWGLAGLVSRRLALLVTRVHFKPS